MAKLDLYKPFLDIDIRNNGPVTINNSNFSFLQINRVTDCLRERGDLKVYSKNDKCLALINLNDGLRDLMLLVLDSDYSVMNFYPGSKLLVNLNDLVFSKGIYICNKSHIRHLGGTVYELKQAYDMALEAFSLRKMGLYNKKSVDGPPKFKPLQYNESQINKNSQFNNRLVQTSFSSNLTISTKKKSPVSKQLPVSKFPASKLPVSSTAPVGKLE